jgi:tRNA threonylcarbamoyladenosine biosynthesis protein TsaE
MFEWQYQTHSSEETMELGRRLGKLLPAGSVICLFGTLAAGKTTLVKGLAEGSIGCTAAEVHSPTFTYMHMYSGEGKNLYHFDLYRLSEDPSKAASAFHLMGFDEFFSAGELCCVEWPERITSCLPQNSVNILLDHVQNDARKITIRSPISLPL